MKKRLLNKKIFIRDALSADIAAISQLHANELKDKVQQQKIELWVAAGNMILAEIDEVIVGYAVIEYTFFDYGFVSILYVTKEHRRIGVASKLLTHLESVCKTDKLFSSTNDSNTPMQKLMNATGYLQSGTVFNLDEGDPELFYFKQIAK